MQSEFARISVGFVTLLVLVKALIWRSSGASDIETCGSSGHIWIGLSETSDLPDGGVEFNYIDEEATPHTVNPSVFSRLSP